MQEVIIDKKDVSQEEEKVQHIVAEDQSPKKTHSPEHKVIVTNEDDDEGWEKQEDTPKKVMSTEKVKEEVPI